MKNTPTYRLYLSDAYGKNEPDPTQATLDIDAIIETDLACMEDCFENDDRDEMERLAGGFPIKFNTRGRPVTIPRHVAGLLSSWHEKYAEKLKEFGIYNGLFVNFAPRIKKGENGPLFYEIEMEDPWKAVTTYPADILAGVRERFRSVAEIPNEVFQGTQFRSRDAHKWLRKNHKRPKRYLDDQEIERLMLERKLSLHNGRLPIEFTDIYGNLICRDDAEVRKKLLEVAQDQRNQIDVTIGKKTLEGEAAVSLGNGTPGKLLVYPNGGHIDIAQKWENGKETTFGDEESAYHLFEKPRELVQGVIIKFPDGTTSENLQIADGAAA